jgi:hypothetical protein
VAGRTSAGARPTGSAPTPSTAPASGRSLADRVRAAGAATSSTPGTVVDNGAGVILAILAWGWVGLPLVQGGPTQVKNVIRAKFLNKGPDGSWLP